MSEIRHSHGVLGGADELMVLIESARVDYEPGLVKDYATALSDLAFHMIGEFGATYINEQRENLATIEQTLFNTNTQPQGFIRPTGSELAQKWHRVRTWARFMLRLDLGDNAHLTESLARIGRIAFQLALKANADAGIEEELYS